MASGQNNKSLVTRAAAILTTGEVAANRLDVNETWGGNSAVQVDFTLGSLTNVILRFYASMDGTTWYQIHAGTSILAPMTATLTASGTVTIPLPCLTGWKFVRASAQGTGTVTASSLTLTHRFVRRGSQG